MPLYQYTCFNCGTEKEELRKVAEIYDGPQCPKCCNKMTFTLSPGPKPTDHLYPFMEENFEHNPVKINSLKHYYSEQKKRGLVDNGKPRGVKGQWV